ncbi:glycosyltransferase [Pantoea septica]|uniref:glycosyltransferase n=1 Tax=Pantoea septica TaxID=472695 RepID=UPI00289E7E01|nr:glycosyltransferase [Pantoea septica]
MKQIVHIKISDRGWILEKLAKEITNRLPYVSYGLESDPSAKIQYYMTYGCRKERVSPVEVALFTHKENVPSAAEKFDAVAGDVDFCIAQSLRTEEILSQLNCKKYKTISPGVDLERFNPKVRIGVVGRTYHTGRKGESLVAQVMDIPEIEWHFTGEGWPGPAQHIPEGALPEFYRSLDYILVPALIEGGPMCVLEALASGCKVIASPVGWVPQFPHIEFKLGDAADLRRVLLEAVEEKLKLRRSVENYTWQAWAEQHHELFCQLLNFNPMQNKDAVFAPVENPSLKKEISALVAVHGQEMTTSLGGPSVRAPKTVAALRKIGLNADFAADRTFQAEEYDVIHALNVWHPSECELVLRQIEKHDRPAVFSPIFLDLSELQFFNQRVKLILSMHHYMEDINQELAALRTELDQHRSKPVSEREPIPGYFAAVRRLTSYASHLILLSELEKDLLKEIGVKHPSISIVKNPVDATVFSHADPELFREQIGVKDYVLCVGRIESRKNQALLALALKDTQLPLVLIGHEADHEYAELIKKWGGDNVIFVGRVESNSPMLASAFAGSKVFCLASWSEGAPLVALEAAASGCNMVLSNRSSEKEYFGDLARYVDPADVIDMRTKILDAWNDSESVTSEKAEKLKAKMRIQHSWENYAVQTKQAYEAAIEFKNAIADNHVAPVPRKKRVFVDLTTVAHHKGPPTGITRVELCVAEALHESYGDEIHYIVWNSHHRKFIRINYSVAIDGSIKLLSEMDSTEFTSDKPEFECHFRKNDLLLVFGSAWIRNLNYIKSLKTLKLMHGVSIVSAIYDVIEYKLKYMFTAERRNQFSLNCKEMIAISDKVLTCSEQTRRDLIEFCQNNDTPLCPVSVFRLGDEPVHVESDAQYLELSELPASIQAEEKFVLYVSTLNVRKNHSQLLMLWQSLINEYGDAVPKLVLVGSIGWGGEEAVDIIDSHPRLKEKVELLHDINDATLAWLYKRCLFTVYPSRYEGWGLPVAESCCYGKFCLASNAGSLPEVAPDCAEYIDPMDSIAWFKALKKYCFNPELLAEKTALAKTYTPTTWITTARQVIEQTRDVKTTERLASLSPGSAIDFASVPQPGALESKDFTLSGWGNSEARGTWTTGHEAVLGFQFDEAQARDLALRLVAFGFSPDGEDIKVSVFVNNDRVAKWSVAGNISELQVPVAAKHFAESRNILLRLKIENAKSPSQFGSGDMRILGLHMLSATLIYPDELSDAATHVAANGPAAPYVVATSSQHTVIYRIKNKLRRIKRTLINA